MSDISQIKVGDKLYDIKDAVAREGEGVDSHIRMGVLGNRESTTFTGGLVFIVVGDVWGFTSNEVGIYVCSNGGVEAVSSSNTASVTANGYDYTLAVNADIALGYIAIINEKTDI